MIYFSYNDFMDYAENGEIDEIRRVEENIVKYEIKNGVLNVEKNKIIALLKEKEELKSFLREFLNYSEQEKIIYYNDTEFIANNKDSIVCKINNKEMFIFIKVVENIDNNISYKMLENSLSIIEKWNKKENEHKRHPIVIPIVIYIGEREWKNRNEKKHEKINYITYKDNRINFSYNTIKINNLSIDELKNMQSKVADEILKLKNKYLQINQ